ncbi:MAG: hypothetical protein J2P53_10960, partial [Bradyrhizobiaceae bacterium]|nr:hypothetical protein [Bradyrhizobiaceae bacterium]
MPGTSRTKPTKPIYDAPSRLSQGLVAGLSVAVVMMAGWFVATVSQRAATTVKADAGAAANPRTPAPAAGPATGEPPASVHFDWPAFTAQPAPSSPRTALPQAPEISPGGDPARATWRPATPAPDGRDRGAQFPA